MEEALCLADQAAGWGDVPVGAVVVLDGRVIGRGANRRVADGDALAHAELLALRDAASSLGHWRLDGASLFVTLEPCPMCAGALVQSRVTRVVYGADDPKLGAVRSRFQICDDPRSYHRLAVQTGVLAQPCAAILQRFFSSVRQRQGAANGPARVP